MQMVNDEIRIWRIEESEDSENPYRRLILSYGMLPGLALECLPGLRFGTHTYEGSYLWSP